MGLFWDDVIVGTRRQEVRIAPPVPNNGWRLPTEFPSLAGQGAIAVDVETFDPDLKAKGPGTHRGGYICGVAVGTQAGFRQYYPVRHKDGPNCEPAKVFGWLSEQLALPVAKVGANLLYDLEYLALEGVQPAGPFYDVQVAEPLLDETQLSYSLENIAQRHLQEGKRDEEMSDWLERAYGASRIKENIWRAPPSIVAGYAIGDIDLPLRIFEIQAERLKREHLWELFELESKLIPLLLAMRQRGVPVNTSAAEELKGVLETRQKEVEAEIKRQTGIQPAIWAADGLAKIFDHIGVPYPRTEKTNAPSFRKGWLEQQSHPVAKLLADARRFDKFRGTFVEGYILNGHVERRLYCQFHQLRGENGGAVSGRFASSGPNLQNIPIRDPELGVLMRQMFEAEPGELWYKLDWSQIEFRLAVHYAAISHLRGANRVVEQYHTDPSTDYHKVTAQLTGLSRSAAKSINFGIIYGLGVDKLCASLGTTIREGESILAQYHSKLPFVKPLYRKASNRAIDKGRIKTVLGRLRRFPMWECGNQYFHENDMLENGVMDPETGRVPGGWKRAFTHSALNALLQGSAADIMKAAMVRIHESGVMDVLGAPHLTVHDELDGSMPDMPAAHEALAEVRNIMQTCVPLEIPLVSDLAIGTNWGNAK